MHVVECAGGVERYLRMLGAGLSRNRFYQILVCSDDYEDVDFPYMDRIIHISDMHNELSLINDIRSIHKVRRIIKADCPDIVYCHSSKGGGVGRLAALGLPCKVVYNPHGWAFNIK